ncbi:winged helix-turn-helix transcriptional regulator [Clostridium aciditolerans]|uniref:Winged helix-turn-helix transcriptional regulator n=1 Tax=Clostridium aciditolerans TaxID=339861 RepID=A0A934HXX4_9CLOT|nr:metalloregulator ArsR/SmtB family transcription factor [Clostridium aciditolerans]MBI6873279.1 winged helix-turn-helix transcriptional regulator [Clostridium aciditolerans]
MDLIQVMKALADETRIRILNILKDGGLCVCEIELLLDINQSNASRHLNKLTSASILEYYKVAKYVYYKINEDTVKEFPFLKEIIEEQAIKLEQCSKDYERLKKYKSSNLGCEDIKEGRVCLDINLK